MPESSINPWSSTPSLDVEKTFAEFGIDPIAPVLRLPEIPYFMRRGIVVGQRDYLPIARAIRNHTPFHLIDRVYAKRSPPPWSPDADARGRLARTAGGKRVRDDRRPGIVCRERHDWGKCREFGKEYLSCLYALGFEGQTYFQSRNERLKDLAFEAATKVNFSELTAIYGFSRRLRSLTRTA